LVEFSLSLPEEQRWRGEWPKAVLRQAMDGILPDLVRLRKDKADFISTFDREFQDQQSHKVEELIRTSVLETFQIVDSNQLLRLFEDYRKGLITDSIRNTLETVVWLEIWHRLNMGKPKGGDWNGRR
jgi:asparagine synthase (glutamine-hydrolysing)